MWGSTKLAFARALAARRPSSPLALTAVSISIVSIPKPFLAPGNRAEARETV